MSAKDARKFAAELRDLGVRVEERGHEFKVFGPTGRLLGAYGFNVNKGSTKKNILAQVRRSAT